MANGTLQDMLQNMKDASAVGSWRNANERLKDATDQKEIDYLNGVKKNAVMSGVMSGLQGANSILNTSLQAAQIADPTMYEYDIWTASQQGSGPYYDYGQLAADQANATYAGQVSDSDIRGMTTGEKWGSVGTGALAGAMTGAEIGGPWGAVIGGAVGGLASLGGVLAGNTKAHREAIRLNNQADIANVYRTREADDSCIYYFDQAVELARSQGDSLLVTNIQNQLAGYYLWHEDYGKARPLLFAGLRDSIAGGLCFMLADLYHHTGPQDSARYYCQLLLKEEDTGLRQMAHKWLAEILLAEGHTAEAAQHLEQYELLTDSLMQETDTEALHRVSALYDYSQREQENARLQRRVIVIAAVAAVLLMLLLAVLLYFSRRRLQYRMKLQQLEHLLTDYRKDYTKTAERQQQILTETPICQRINRLLGDSRHPSMTDEDWHILEDTFMKVQPSFLNRLREFHRFSSHELHICLLLRLRLQPAAIGQLTAHSKQSISSTRSRLFEKVFGQKGTPAQWDEFILSL